MDHEDALNLYQNDKVLDQSKFKEIVGDKINAPPPFPEKKKKKCFGKDKQGKESWERKKCWLPAFSPFLTMFSKCILVRAIKVGGLCSK